MYHDLIDAELQATLLAESISDDAILADEPTWQAVQALRCDVRDIIALRQDDTTDADLIWATL